MSIKCILNNHQTEKKFMKQVQTLTERKVHHKINIDSFRLYDLFIGREEFSLPVKKLEITKALYVTVKRCYAVALMYQIN